jgi:hypothetical protein
LRFMKLQLSPPFCSMSEAKWVDLAAKMQRFTCTFLATPYSSLATRVRSVQICSSKIDLKSGRSELFGALKNFSLWDTFMVTDWLTSCKGFTSFLKIWNFSVLLARPEIPQNSFMYYWNIRFFVSFIILDAPFNIKICIVLY